MMETTNTEHCVPSQSGAVLLDKVAVVTGAAGDIGCAVARRFLDEGARVLMVDLHDTRLRLAVEALGARESHCAMALCDISDREQALRSVRSAVSRFGRLDILVNGAAAMTPGGTVADLEPEDWQRAVDVNLSGTLWMSQAAIREMRRNGGGVIVHIASQLGQVGAADRAAYGATKAALIQLARAMAIDHAAEGIRVVSLSPGAILTSRLTDRYGGEDEVIAALGHKYPVGRLGTPEEVASAAAFIASDRASFMTGADLLVDGGYTAP